jgi:DNA-binding transcriptional ArsR family regulator
VSQPTVSKHLKVLREAELVSVREEGSTATTACPPRRWTSWTIGSSPFRRSPHGADAGRDDAPESAAAAADLVGRAAASTKHAFDSMLKRIPGR